MGKLIRFQVLISVALLCPSAAALAVDPATSSAAPVKGQNCSAAKDFVLTLEYLRTQKDMQVPEEDARKIAMKVAGNCSGASKRMIRVSQLLVKAGLTPKDALNQSIEFAAKTDREAETFIGVFKRAFLAEFLDLDVGTSIRLARSLSSEFSGDKEAVLADFERVVEFCVQSKKLDLPKPTCADLSSRIAKKGEIYNGGVSKDFIMMVDFLRNPKDGPGITTDKAIAQAEEIVTAGAGASENFMAGFRYAVKPKGLGMTVEQAFDFAKNLTFQVGKPGASKASK